MGYTCLFPFWFPALSLYQHQGLFKRVSSSHQVATVLEFRLQHSPSNEHPGLISFRIDWLDPLAVQGTLKSLLQHHSSKASILWHYILSLFRLNAMLHYFKYLLPISSVFFSWSFSLSTWENPAWAHSNSSPFLKEPILFSASRNISKKLVSYASLNVWFSDSTDFSKEYYSAIKKNAFESVLMRWMKLEPTIQSEGSQKEKYQYSILTHIYRI